MISVIFDCDPGHDDIFALCTLVAHPEKFSLLGCTTVAGNQTIEKVTDNLLRVLSFLHIDCPVSQGAATSLIGKTFVQPDAHGESGMDGPLLPQATVKLTGTDAVQWMMQTIVESHQKVTIVATGPLTNVATLLQKYPQVKNNIEQISIMGGSIYSGNITPSAEFNIYVDPLAANIVFNSGCKLVMSGLEVCHQAMILHSEIELFNQKGRASTLVYQLLDFYSLYAKQLNQPGSPLFDLCPVMHLLKPELFTTQPFNIDVEIEGLLTQGKTVADLRSWADSSKANVEVVLTTDRHKFIKEFVASIRILD